MRPDHRSAVAGQRREKMRARLIEAALLVVAAKGLDGAMIDDVAAAAGVSRGSFYNHFFTLQELLLAANRELADELVGFVLAEVADLGDPAEVVAHGTLMFLQLAQAHPLLARFAAGMGLAGLAQGSVANAVLPPVLARGMSVGRFATMPMPEARDMMGATLLACLARTARGDTVDFSAIAAALLRALGVGADEAARLATRPVAPPAIPPDSLVARTEAVRSAS